MCEFGECDMDFGGDDAGGGDLLGGDAGGGDVLSNDFPEDNTAWGENSGGDFNVEMGEDTTNIDVDPNTIDDLESQGYEMNIEVTAADSNTAFTDATEPNDIEEDNMEGADIPEDAGSEDEIPEDTESDTPENEEAEEESDKPESVRDKLKDMREDNPGESKGTDFEDPPVYDRER